MGVDLPHHWKGQQTVEKRKIIAATDKELPTLLDTASLAVRATRASRRTIAPKAAGESTGVKAAPKRKSIKSNGATTKNTLTTKASSIAARTKPSKEVIFNENKENHDPVVREATMTCHEGDDTDELMSSMGALSVKPLRIPSTKLPLPSTSNTTISAFEPIPSLSPSKARRPPRILSVDDGEMEDELSSPMPPVLKLVAKPKRGGVISSSRGRGEAVRATGPRKPLDLSASLFTSPARRLPTSPFKPTTANAPLPRLSADVPATVSRSSLASPARRPPTVATSSFGSPIKSAFRPSPMLTLKMETPNLPKPGIKSPPKRVKMPNLAEIDAVEDELGMDLDDYLLGRLPPRFIKQDMGHEGLIEKMSVGHVDTAVELNAARHGCLYVSKSSTLRSLPTSPPAKNYATLKIQERHGSNQTDVNIKEPDSIKDLYDTNHMINQISPITKRYKIPIERGGSCSFFDLEDHEDELSPPQYTDTLSTFCGPELRSGEGNLFPSAFVPKQLGDEIPIDPLLLSLSLPDNFLGIIESPTRKTTIPVKTHSVDDMIEDEDYTSQENQQFPNQLHIWSKSNRGCPLSQPNAVIRMSSVLAGAVIFVDVYTSDGADASSAFAEALRGLGAKVLKNWNWNPNSTGGPGEGERKVGITHVVFKDGSPRTLQKVKDSKGVVLCVGVGWVTSCEEEQAWIDESMYPVDLDHIPRGGHRVSSMYAWVWRVVLSLTFPQRRKSMEPKSVTPMPVSNYHPISTSDKSTGPPKTPKSTSRKFLFPQTELPHKREAESNPLLVQNILMARRKSMQFAPKTGSPLRRFAVFTID